LWTFTVRFLQAKAEIQALDKSDPLPQPGLENEQD
jgi:hypothetical protein